MIDKRWTMFLSILLMMTLLWPSDKASAQTPTSAKLYIDGQRASTTVIMQNGYQLVPASFFRNFNVSVEWNTQNRSAVLRTSLTEISFPVNERHNEYSSSGKLSRDYLDTRTKLINGVAYVPLAYTARKLGFQVDYDSNMRATLISTGNDFQILSTQKQVTEEELYWLYQITEAEAGAESYNGKVAVAASILNRVDNPDWPDTIIDTIFQVEYYNGKAYYQYSPVLDKRINTVTPSNETKEAVQDALNGVDPSFGAIVFYNPTKTDNQWVRSREVTTQIGNHIFAK